VATICTNAIDQPMPPWCLLPAFCNLMHTSPLCQRCDVTRGPRPDSPWPSHIKYTTMVGITICIVIRLQESVVACVLQPWSGGKDPDRYNGIRGDVTDTLMMRSSQWRTIQCSKPSGTTQVITHLSLDSWGVKVGVL
jgi:hypothetical protein